MRWSWVASVIVGVTLVLPMTARAQFELKQRIKFEFEVVPPAATTHRQRFVGPTDFVRANYVLVPDRELPDELARFLVGNMDRVTRLMDGENVSANDDIKNLAGQFEQWRSQIRARTGAHVKLSVTFRKHPHARTELLREKYAKKATFPSRDRNGRPFTIAVYEKVTPSGNSDYGTGVVELDVTGAKSSSEDGVFTGGIRVNARVEGQGLPASGVRNRVAQRSLQRLKAEADQENAALQRTLNQRKSLLSKEDLKKLTGDEGARIDLETKTLQGTWFGRTVEVKIKVTAVMGRKVISHLPSLP